MNDELVKALKDELEAFKAQIPILAAESEAFKALKAHVVDQGNRLAKMGYTVSDYSNPKGVLEGILRANKAAIDTVARTKGTEVEFALKANVVRANIASSTTAVFDPSIGELAAPTPRIYNLFRKITIPASANGGGQASYVDWDTATSVRAAAMRSEGVAFPESTAKFTQHNVPLKKLADSIPASNEVLYDYTWMANELDRFLTDNIAQLEEQQLWDGDNTGDNLKGVYAYAPAFTAVASGILAAGIPDLLVKMVETVTNGTKWIPDFVIMSRTDYNSILLKKDKNENYVNVPFIVGNTILGMEVVISDAVTPNTLVIGQASKATIYEDEDVRIMVGVSGTDFEEDLVRLRAKKRELLLIKSSENTAFLKCTSISAALVLLAT